MYLKTAYINYILKSLQKSPTRNTWAGSFTHRMKLDSVPKHFFLPFPFPLSFYRCRNFCFLRVGVGSLLSAESGDDVDEATVVLNATSRPSRLLLLLLLFRLVRLTLAFAGASQGAVDFASEES